jgi:Ca2+-binding RTX toxin-like protein
MLKATVVRANLVTSLVIFDSQVADLPLLYNALLPGSIGHTIQPHQDPINYITHLLTETGATKLAIVAHGQPGAIQIGNGSIDRATLEARSGLLQEWGLDSIALYSCEVGIDAEFINRFAELTGAKIAASNSKLGAGNWELDGGMELLEIGRLADYSDTLAIFNGTAGGDYASQGLPPGIPASITGFTAGFSSLDLLLLTDSVGDTFNGGDGNDTVGAGTGDDILNGEAGDDTLQAGDGNDIIRGGAGSNFLIGGAGNDRIEADMRDLIYGGADNDFLFIDTAVSGVNYGVTFTGANAGTLSTNGTQTGSFNDIEQFYFVGYDGSDTVNASSANLIVTTPGTGYAALQLQGFGGSDNLTGSAGNDKIDGGTGDDYLYGLAGNDTIDGDTGNDRINGGAGSNILNGGDGDDRIDANYMRDTVDGGTGNDFLNIFTQVQTDAYTVIFTGANAGKFQINGADTGTFTSIEQLSFIGYGGNDAINANLANLSVTNQGLSPFGLDINTDAGNDIVLGSAGKDRILGGTGDDALYGQGGEDTIDGGDGFDTIFGGAGIDTLSGGISNDQIFGGTENDIINGDDGEDYLYGDDGDDLIKGGYGFDVIYGLAGNDTIYGEGLTLDAFGEDTTVAPAPGVGINDTIFGGLGNDSIYGGIGDDVLLGEEGNDGISGGDGNDFIYGGIGDDNTLYGDAGNDYIVGQDGNDKLRGGDGSDYISGDAGDDNIGGGFDNDFLYGNVGIDTINGDAGNDFLDGGDGGDFLYGNDGIDTIFGVEGNDTISGGAAQDYLYGGIGDDNISGDAGNDFLIGGAGSDILTGGTDSDRFVYFAMTDAGDTITDFDVSATGDKLNLSGLFASIGVASGAVTIGGPYLKFFQAGADAICQVDQDGAGLSYNLVSIATLNNVNAATQLALGFNVIV